MLVRLGGSTSKRAQTDTFPGAVAGSHKIDLQYPLSFINPSFLGIFLVLGGGCEEL